MRTSGSESATLNSWKSFYLALHYYACVGPKSYGLKGSNFRLSVAADRLLHRRGNEWWKV